MALLVVTIGFQPITYDCSRWAIAGLGAMCPACRGGAARWTVSQRIAALLRSLAVSADRLGSPEKCGIRICLQPSA